MTNREWLHEALAQTCFYCGQDIATVLKGAKIETCMICAFSDLNEQGLCNRACDNGKSIFLNGKVYAEHMPGSTIYMIKKMLNAYIVKRLQELHPEYNVYPQLHDI